MADGMTLDDFPPLEAYEELSEPKFAPKLIGENWRADARIRLGLLPMGADPMPRAIDVPPRLRLGDTGNARRLWELAGGDLHWVREARTWRRWDGAKWAPSSSDVVCAIARLVPECISREADSIEREGGDSDVVKSLRKFAIRSTSRSSISAMVDLLKSEPGVEIRSEELDPASWSICTVAGAYSLIDATILPPSRRQRNTHAVAIEPDIAAECPTWRAWLVDVLGSQELAEYLQLLVGYSMTPSVAEQILVICSGEGSNGKSTLFRTLAAIMGDYAMVAPTSLLLADDRANRHPTEVAALAGKRVAYAVETPEDARFSAERVKMLTGGDRISARFMNADFFAFAPTHKLWLGTNHLPQIRDNDHAIWRRVRVVPFPHTFWRLGDPRMPVGARLIDPTLEGRIAAELPGILGWAIAGAGAWHARRQAGLDGLPTPGAVSRAIGEYRAENDRVAAFLDACVVVDGTSRETVADVYRKYTEYCTSIGERAESMRVFGHRLTSLGVGRETSHGVRYRTGVRLRLTQGTAGWATA